jgi:hypothetical protein
VRGACEVPAQHLTERQSLMNDITTPTSPYLDT